MGADIKGQAPTPSPSPGVDNLYSATYRVMPDRIEAGTLLAPLLPWAKSTLLDAPVTAMDAIFDKLRDAGCSIAVNGSNVTVSRKGPLKAVSVKTAPYPAFPTDMQAQLMAMNVVARRYRGDDREHFENRMMHVSELCRLARKSTSLATPPGTGREPAEGRQRNGHRPARLGQPVTIAGPLRHWHHHDRPHRHHLDRGLRTYRGQADRPGKATIERVSS